MNMPKPDMEHPVVQVVMTLAQRGSKERYVLDEEAQAELERTLIAHGEDPNLPAGLLGLYGLAGVLWNEESSKSAATAIFLAIARSAPHFVVLRDKHTSFAEDAARRFDALTARERAPIVAPRLDDKAPPGTLKVSSFLEPNAAYNRRGAR